MSKNKKISTTLPLSVSQNFLTSTSTIKNLLQKTTITKNDTLIEIGPGKGHITKILSEHCHHVTAIELDKRLFKALKSAFASYENVTLVYQDFLTYPLPTKNTYKVLSNVPFSITTDIMKKLTRCINPPTEAWLTMEKGAAKRFLGHQKENLQSLILKPFFDLKIVHFFRREDFHPSPKVEVVLLQIQRKKTPDLPIPLQKEFERFLRIGISGGIYQLLTKKQVSRSLKEAALSAYHVDEETEYIQWLCLFRSYAQLVLKKNV